MSTKNGSLNVGDCNSCIKSIDKTNDLTLGMILSSVTKNSTLALFPEPQLTLQAEFGQM